MAGKAAVEREGSRRRERMRLILIEAAMRLFAEQGVDGTTIDEIVDVAGVAKGTFYNYFTDRADISRAVAAAIRHEFNEAVEELNRGVTDGAERATRGVRLFLAVVAFAPVRARMLARLYEGGFGIDSTADRYLISDLKDGIRQGQIHVPSLEAAHHLVIGVATAGMRFLLDHGAREEVLRGEGYAKEIATVILQGLGVKETEIEKILARPFEVVPRDVFKQGGLS